MLIQFGIKLYTTADTISVHHGADKNHMKVQIQNIRHSRTLDLHTLQLIHLLQLMVVSASSEKKSCSSNKFYKFFTIFIPR